LRLSFKKLKLFEKAIKTLGVTHHIGGRVQILEEKVWRIASWPTPQDQTGVKGFLGAVCITRRWIRNYSELSRALSRLTGKVE